MAVLSLQDVSLGYGGPLLLDRITVHVESGERVALLGRNGVGKSSLMKVIAGQLRPDTGGVFLPNGGSVAYLPQEVPSHLPGRVYDIVLSGLGERARLLTRYHQLSQQLTGHPDAGLLTRLDEVQSELDRTGSWHVNNQVEEVISRLHLDAEQNFSELSGGRKRRVFLARMLVCAPAVLLLDEPTNHLDIDSIVWLEKFLSELPATILFVTHDRSFLSHLATRILELDRGKVLSWSCDYPTYLQRRQAALASETASWNRQDKKLAAEEVWVRQGIKARRCRNEGRVKALEQLRRQRQERRARQGTVRMQAQNAEYSGHRVLKASRVRFGYGDSCLVQDFSTVVMRADKIGVIGPNGSGKTTLLRVLLGQLAPQSGKITLGTNLEIAYYDQLREQLDPEKSVAENLNGTAETILINGKPRHILGYLQDFLFDPERSRGKVASLSGGERNRLLLAKLFARPSNVLVMDEPTNDLDIETIELLEELLLGYPGTLLLVSHDRSFLNNVVSSTMVLDGTGTVAEYPGGYDDWLEQRPEPAATPAPKKKTPVAEKNPKPRKLTYKESRELDELPERIDRLETEQRALYARFSASDFYRSSPEEIARAQEREKELTRELAAAMRRWEELGELAGGTLD